MKKTSLLIFLFITIICLVGCKTTKEEDPFDDVKEALASSNITYQSYQKTITIKYGQTLLAEEVITKTIQNSGMVDITTTTKKLNNLDADVKYSVSTSNQVVTKEEADLFYGYDLDKNYFSNQTTTNNNGLIEFKGTVKTNMYSSFVEVGSSSIQDLVITITLNSQKKVQEVVITYTNSSTNTTSIVITF